MVLEEGGKHRRDKRDWIFDEVRSSPVIRLRKGLDTGVNRGTLEK